MKIMQIFRVHHQHLQQLVMYLVIVFKVDLILMIMNNHQQDFIKIIIVDLCAVENIIHQQ